MKAAVVNISFTMAAPSSCASVTRDSFPFYGSLAPSCFSDLREARHFKAVHGLRSRLTTSIVAKLAFQTVRGLGSVRNSAYASGKDDISFGIKKSFPFNNDQPFQKSERARFDSNQSFTSTESFGSNQRLGTESEGNKLYVGNLPWSANKQRLEEIFQEAGTVELVEVIVDKITGRCRGFAFVTMGSPEEAEAAIAKLDGYVLVGRAIKVNISSRQSGGGPRGIGGFSSGNSSVFGSPEVDERSQVFIGNLPWGADEVALENMFLSYGEVLDARIVYDRDTGRSRGFGFVTFSSPSEASEAVSRLNGTNIEGRPVRVNLAADRQHSRF